MTIKAVQEAERGIDIGMGEDRHEDGHEAGHEV